MKTQLSRLTHACSHCRDHPVVSAVEKRLLKFVKFRLLRVLEVVEGHD